MTRIGRYLGSHRYRRACSALSLLAAITALATACEPPTSFKGEPKVAGGPPACFELCRSQNMQMAAFVYVGEFSTACACAPRAVPGQASNEGATSAAVVAAASGVETQRRLAEEQAQRNNNTFMLQH